MIKMNDAKRDHRSIEGSRGLRSQEALAQGMRRIAAIRKSVLGQQALQQKNQQQNDRRLAQFSIMCSYDSHREAFERGLEDQKAAYDDPTATTATWSEAAADTQQLQLLSTRSTAPPVGWSTRVCVVLVFAALVVRMSQSA